MSSKTYSVITGTGSYIPTKRVLNEDFQSNEFYNSNGSRMEKSTDKILEELIKLNIIRNKIVATVFSVINRNTSYIELDQFNA